MRNQWDGSIKHIVHLRAASSQLEEVDLIHFLEPGTWFLSLINDDPLPVSLALQPSVARDVPTSCPSQCHGHGSCRLGQCHCFPGYIGLDCADSVCPVLCSGHGRLVQGRCRCEPGWKGAECAVRDDLCELPDCSGHGRCVRGRCICEPGFGGDNCERPDCPDPECGSRGACVQGRCWCKPGWRGANCSDADERLSRCLPDCSAHGVYDLEREACVCFEQWTGDDCSRGACPRAQGDAQRILKRIPLFACFARSRSRTYRGYENSDANGAPCRATVAAAFIAGASEMLDAAVEQSG